MKYMQYGRYGASDPDLSRSRNSGHGALETAGSRENGGVRFGKATVSKGVAVAKRWIGLI